MLILFDINTILLDFIQTHYTVMCIESSKFKIEKDLNIFAVFKNFPKTYKKYLLNVKSIFSATYFSATAARAGCL